MASHDFFFGETTRKRINLMATASCKAQLRKNLF